jgi:hypothetical protein
LKTKIVTYEIEYCNSLCSQFFHNYEDNENCWCARLNKKIFEVENDDNIFDDLKSRVFPVDCPLEDAV